MKTTKKVYLISSLIVLMSAASCAKYNASPLYVPSPDWVQTTIDRQGIKVLSKTFTRDECNIFLDRDVISEGYQPLQLYIQNDSDKNYIFSLNQISLPTAKSDEVAYRVHTSTAGRAAGYGVGALFFLPLVIPAVVDGVGSSKANDALDHDFSTKVARDQILLPHSHLNAVIFVPLAAYQDSFTVILTEKESNEPLQFDVVSRR